MVNKWKSDPTSVTGGGLSNLATMHIPIQRTKPLDVYADAIRNPLSFLGAVILGVGLLVHLLTTKNATQYLFGGYVVLIIPTLVGLFADGHDLFECSTALTLVGVFMWYYKDAVIGGTIMAINLFMLIPRMYENLFVHYPELEPKKPCGVGLHEIESKPDPVLLTTKATKEDLERELLRLRNNFKNYTHLRSYECRLSMINHIAKGFEEMKDEFIEALKQDLGGDKDAVYVNHILGIKSAVAAIQRGLKQWMKRQYVETPAGLAPGNSYILYQPLGVIGILGCWNFPIMLALQPLLEAVSAGNCVCVKLSEVSSHTEKALMKFIGTYCHPHYVSCVVGDHNVAIPFSQMKFDKIMFTGGWEVGRHVAKACADNFVPCIIESGGKNPVIVDASADLETAAMKLAFMGFLNAGQLCLRPDALYVHESKKEKFAALLKKQVLKQWGETPEAIKNGNFGIMVNEKGAGRVEGIIKEHDGKVLVGGECDGRYIAPTVIMEPKLGSTAQKEEIFGPIMQIYGFNDIQEVFDQSYEKRKDLEKPLATYYFGKKENQDLLLENMTAGSMCINDACWQNFNKNIPFGGVGKSGQGTYSGKHGFIGFSHACGVLEKPHSDTAGLGLPPLSNWMWLYNFMAKYQYYLGISQWAALKRLGLVILSFILVALVFWN